VRARDAIRKMLDLYEENLKVTPGCSDARGRLGIYETFRAFMDMAAIHAELLGVGYQALLEKGLFWLTVKTHFDFIKRPPMRSDVTLRTWPEAPGRLRTNRSYEAVMNGETVITGKTEWAVIDTAKNRLVTMKGIFPEELDFDRPSASPDPFMRIPDEFTPEEEYAEFRVSSVDIDVGGHMNNAAYVRAIVGSISNAELDRLSPKSMTVIFRTPCFEGELLKLYKRETEEYVWFKIERAGETAVLAGMEK